MRADDIERELIGAAILDPTVTATTELSEHHFGLPAHGAMWEAIKQLHQQGTTPTPPLIADAATGWARVDVTQVVELVGYGISANADKYRAEILDAYDKRRLAGVADQIRQGVQGDITAETIRDDARVELDGIAKHQQHSHQVWREIEPDIIDLMESGSREGLRTPWPDLDRYLHGLLGSRCYVVAARPGEGKSLMAQGLATHMAVRHRKATLFASLEMSREDLGVRIIASASGVSLDQLQSGAMTEEQWEKVSYGRGHLDNMPLHVDDTAEQTMGHIRAAAIDVARTQDLGMVVIDYLQLVQPADERVNRETQVSKISRAIKLLSRELGIPVIALSQLNRKSLDRTDKRPTLGDLRESGAQEQDADVVILMNLDDETGELHVQVAKNRHGAKGHLDLQMWGSKAELRNVTDRRMS